MLSRRALIRAAAAGAGASGMLALTGPPATSAAASPLRDCQPRYQGYRAADRAKPYAKYMVSSTRPMQRGAARAHAAPAIAATAVPPLADLPRDLRPKGYSPLEYGYGRNAHGQVWVATRTVMPRNTAAMWDWWFGWHSVESARYKLWQPDAHRYAGIRHDLRHLPDLTDRQRYVGNTSYVDEYIGPQLEQLAISFVDPSQHGFTVPTGQTVILAQVGSSTLGLRLGWLAHQVRPITGGAEMRSRFYLNVPAVAGPDVQAATCALERGVSDTLIQPLPFGVDFGRDLLAHCAQEMNHLAHFLPELHLQFRGTP